MELDEPIVIDAGSGDCKVGFAGDDAPTAVFPSIVAEPQNLGNAWHSKSSYVGEEAKQYLDVDITYPMGKDGNVQDWTAMRELFNHTFSKLRVDPYDRPILLTETPRASLADRKKLAEIMFEEHNVPSLSFALQELLVLYTSSSITGVVLSAGEGETYIVAVNDGRPILSSTLFLPYTGKDLTDYLTKLIDESGYRFPCKRVEVSRNVQKMKETLCYVATDIDWERQEHYHPSELERSCEFSNGHGITIGKERFLCPEALFQPSVMNPNWDCPGIHESLFDSINRSERGIRRELYRNIHLSGGSTLFPGMKERLQRELLRFAPKDTRITIRAPPERKYSSWIGGSILASMPNAPWASSKDYNEMGVVRALEPFQRHWV